MSQDGDLSIERLGFDKGVLLRLNVIHHVAKTVSNLSFGHLSQVADHNSTISSIV